MDADDLSLPSRLGRLAQAARNDDADIVGSWAHLINGEGQRIGSRAPPTEDRAIRRAMRWTTPFLHPTVMLRRSFLLQVGGYLGGFRTEDIDLWLRCSRSGGRFANIPEYLFEYRLHGDQASRSRLVYAEGASYRLREFVLRPSVYRAASLVVSLGKALFAPLMIRRAFNVGKSSGSRKA